MLNTPSISAQDVNPNSDLFPTFSLLFDDMKEHQILKLSDSDIARSYYQLAKIFYDKADFVKAEEAFLRAVMHANLNTDYYTILKTYGFLIRIASEMLELKKAERYIFESNQIVETLSRTLPHLTSEYFYSVGVVKNYMGDFESSRNNFELAFTKATEEGESDVLSKCLFSLATGAFYRQEFEVAKRFLDQLSDLLKITKKYYLCGAMYNYFAKIYIEEGNTEKAMEYFALANQYLQSKKCWNLQGYILYGKALAMKKAGSYEWSLNLFHLADESIDKKTFKRLHSLITQEIDDVNDCSVDLYLDRTNRKVVEKDLGIIDFKHRFVLLEILFLLSKAPGVYFDKEQLAKMIWKDEYNPLIHDKLIYTSVSRLRKLIEPEDEGSIKRKYIIRGKDGYTFNPQSKIRFKLETRTNAARSIGNVDLSSPV